MRSHGFEEEIDEVGEQRLELVLRLALEGLGLRLAESEAEARATRTHVTAEP